MQEWGLLKKIYLYSGHRVGCWGSDNPKLQCSVVGVVFCNLNLTFHSSYRYKKSKNPCVISVLNCKLTDIMYTILMIKTIRHKWWTHKIASLILKLRIYEKNFTESEFVNLFLCTMNVNNNIQFCRFLVSKYSWNRLISRSKVMNFICCEKRLER